MAVTVEDVRTALSAVKDPEIRRPITDLGMVDTVAVDPAGGVDLTVLLTIAACPLRDTLTRDVTAAVRAVPGVTDLRLTLGVMTDDQRSALRDSLKGGATKDIPFARPESRTRVYAIASGKGGVGKSTVTVNLAAALAAQGLAVGVLDADVYGFSIPRMLGVTGRPTRIGEMILPPVAHGIKVISVGMFVDGNTPVVWRGPMLHRALQQFLADVFWGDLDVLLLDLPPGTGDIAISTAQLIPSTEILVVTTPQTAAAEVAERAGAIALQTRQKVAGVIENMSPMLLPDGSRMALFGSGGGRIVADSLSRATGTTVELLGQVPLEVGLREAGDSGTPLVLTAPTAPAAQVLRQVADGLARRSRPLAGVSLGISPKR
ncbi:Mrp/NBP35 family ATP-binding protein [Nakamurella flavida]|uniref:Iron-sulfur cluster carrier protein n=1 Tax=Nakamurella flavida TaxID=363630 RepID=A0A938YC78_9ACTN|nr:P-loop NTPase [Nakamurella flavida]MBM9474981.1 Mrp/NBP35 family ATP-binding protein [Nakamurella flavida]MDP9776550.1 ATP-binding protein involved in chromosome partitioning [Nakamurella flavida]